MQIKKLTGTRKIASTGYRLFDPSAEYFPTIRNGLLWAAPLRDNARSIYDNGIVAYVDPSTQDVDADGTYLDTYDILQDAILNELRIEKNGARLEEIRTNSALHYNALDNAVWAFSATVTPNTTVAPDGTTTADTVTDDSASVGELLLDIATILDDSEWHTYSIYVLKDTNEARFPEFAPIYSGGTSISNSIQINTKTGATIERSASGTRNHYVVDLGNRWQLFIELKNNNTGNTSATLRIVPARTATFGTSEVAAQGSIVAWGIQFEDGRGTSLIPTAASAVTRTSDDLRYLAAGNIDGDACTIVMAITPHVSGADGNTKRFFRWRTGTHWIDASILSGSWNFNIADGTNINLTGTTDILKDRTDIIILTHDGAAAEQKLYVNGVKEGPTRTKGVIVGTATDFSIGSGGGGLNVLPGNYQHNYIYDRALSADECASLTTEIQGWLAA